MSVLLAAGIISGGLQIISGFLGRSAAREQASVRESQARLLRLEAEADTQRFKEKRESFKAQQKVSFLKSGVLLSGSALTVLDETERITKEDISALRARGEARASDRRTAADNARARGRSAVFGGITRAFSTFASTGVFTGIGSKT